MDHILLMQINGNGFRAAIGASNRLNTGIDEVNAWAVETILTFILVLVVFSATDSVQAAQAIHLPVSSCTNLAILHQTALSMHS